MRRCPNFGGRVAAKSVRRTHRGFRVPLVTTNLERVSGKVVVGAGGTGRVLARGAVRRAGEPPPQPRMLQRLLRSHSRVWIPVQTSLKKIDEEIIAHIL